MANETFHLNWHGPFSVIEGTNDPCVYSDRSEVGKQKGVYVWTIPVGDEYLVCYVGKAENQKGLFSRLRTEFRKKHAKHCDIVDGELLLNGTRKQLYKPLDSKGKPDLVKWRVDPEGYTKHRDVFEQSVRLFIAPMQDDQKHIRFAEAALIHTVWDYEFDHWDIIPNDYDWYFLNMDDKNGPKRPTAPYRITMSFPRGIRIRGFKKVNNYTKPREND